MSTDSPQNQFQLLGSRRLLPLFLTQFLGALNDNLFKNALVILIIYRSADTAHGQIMVTVAAGLFILPFFLFSAIAGQLADKFEKSRLIRYIKLWEIGVMALACIGFFFEQHMALLAVLFLMGIQSAFFGPLKYSILPDHLAKGELIGGNGLVEAGTFLAILIGSIAGNLLILTAYGVQTVTGGLMVIALAGWATSLAIPKAGPAVPDLKINPNFLGETFRIIGYIAQDRRVFLSILGISWFWLVGATFLAQFPAFVKDTLFANEQLVSLFMTVFSVGIAIGSVLCNKLLKGDLSAKYVPLGALGMSLFIFDLYVATSGYERTSDSLIGVVGFLEEARNWRILGDLLGIAIAAGLYIVPLYALMQTLSDKRYRARVIAGNNIMNALFMVVSAIGTVVMLGAGFTVPQVFLTVAIINLLVALYICKLLPDALVKGFFTFLFKLAYRIEVRGLEHWAASGQRTLIVANHVSFLDGLLLATLLPEKPLFAVNTHIAQKWWVGPFLTMVDIFPMDPTNPLSTKALIKAVQDGKRCVIFPEGRITMTGALMKIYEGPGMVADKAKADILPIRIDGAQFTPFSRLKGKLRLRWFPKITVTLLPPYRIDVAEELRGRQRREAIGADLYDLMCRVIFETCDRDRSLFQAVLDARSAHGKNALLIEDIQRKPMSYDRLVSASLLLGRGLVKGTSTGEAIGLLLPNSGATAAVFFGLQAHARVPAMLNFTAGARAMAEACVTAGVKRIVTSRQFVELAKLTDAVELLGESRTVIYLEDLRDRIGWWDKARLLLTKPLVSGLHRGLMTREEVTPDSPAVILFTSGSESSPKAVVLSHSNILSNAYQLASRIDFNPTDIVFNPLPVFHSFGLTAGLLLPVLSGIKTFLYPSPLHYRIIPELIYDSNATILFGTNTFLKSYAQKAHAYDFYSLRYVFAGAEKVAEDTRRRWSEFFGLRILEGYGATETSPVLASNTPMQCKAGTVGRLLPGIEHRLEKVEGVEHGGRLWVRGPNVMLGYYRAGAPQKLEPPQDGWYDTGDIVQIDPEGFISIQGRAKRFAKIAGEMVSLTAVEQQAAALWPEAECAAVALPDPKKGEQVILLTTEPTAERGALLAHCQAQGVTELMVPKIVLAVESIPLLGSGKADYQGAQKLAEEMLK
ncbi:MAG: acyl-[ACP]--phospholipid O-acyltransferase [Pseudomonadota bacterium]